MASQITVTRPDPDGLSQQVWTFTLVDSYSAGAALRVARYETQTRATRRHGWVGPYYDAMDNRHYHAIKPADVPLPDDVKTDALQQLLARVTVTV